MDISKLLSDEQDPKIVEKVYTRIKDLLASDEELEYIAVQKKPAVNISPNSVVITSKRIIFFRSKNLGLTMDFEDYIWKDVVDCHIKETLLTGAEFTMKPIRGLEVKIDFLPKVQARKLYQLSQGREKEQVTEIQRQLDIEEKYADPETIVVADTPVEIVQPAPEPVIPEPPVAPSPAPLQTTNPEPVIHSQPYQSLHKNLPEDPAVALQKLKSLFDNGLITARDFEMKKSEILTRL